MAAVSEQEMFENSIKDKVKEILLAQPSGLSIEGLHKKLADSRISLQQLQDLLKTVPGTTIFRTPVMRIRNANAIIGKESENDNGNLNAENSEMLDDDEYVVIFSENEQESAPISNLKGANTIPSGDKPINHPPDNSFENFSLCVQESVLGTLQFKTRRVLNHYNAAVKLSEFLAAYKIIHQKDLDFLVYGFRSVTQCLRKVPGVKVGMRGQEIYIASTVNKMHLEKSTDADKAASEQEMFENSIKDKIKKILLAQPSGLSIEGLHKKLADSRISLQQLQDLLKTVPGTTIFKTPVMRIRNANAIIEKELENDNGNLNAENSEMLDDDEYVVIFSENEQDSAPISNLKGANTIPSGDKPINHPPDNSFENFSLCVQESVLETLQFKIHRVLNHYNAAVKLSVFLVAYKIIHQKDIDFLGYGFRSVTQCLRKVPDVKVGMREQDIYIVSTVNKIHLEKSTDADKALSEQMFENSIKDKVKKILLAIPSGLSIEGLHKKLADSRISLEQLQDLLKTVPGTTIFRTPVMRIRNANAIIEKELENNGNLNAENSEMLDDDEYVVIFSENEQDFSPISNLKGANTIPSGDKPINHPPDNSFENFSLCVQESVLETLQFKAQSVLNHYNAAIKLSEFLVAYKIIHQKFIDFRGYGFRSVTQCLRKVPGVKVGMRGQEIYIVSTVNKMHLEKSTDADEAVSEQEMFENSIKDKVKEILLAQPSGLSIEGLHKKLADSRISLQQLQDLLKTVPGTTIFKTPVMRIRNANAIIEKELENDNGNLNAENSEMLDDDEYVVIFSENEQDSAPISNLKGANTIPSGDKPINHPPDNSFENFSLCVQESVLETLQFKAQSVLNHYNAAIKLSEFLVAYKIIHQKDIDFLGYGFRSVTQCLRKVPGVKVGVREQEIYIASTVRKMHLEKSTDADKGVNQNANETATLTYKNFAAHGVFNSKAETPKTQVDSTQSTATQDARSNPGFSANWKVNIKELKITTQYNS